MLIKLKYKQLIDSQCSTAFEKAVWHDAFEEFCLQSQRYNAGGRFHSLEEMIANDPKANSLHYKVAFAVGLYIQDLTSKVPGWFESLALEQLPFEQCELQIIAADTGSKKEFNLALQYTTPPLYLHGTAGNHYCISIHDENNTDV